MTRVSVEVSTEISTDTLCAGVDELTFTRLPQHGQHLSGD
jgi:hypothetical protein